MTYANELVADELEGHRRLRVIHLWATGVGAVISGDFFGWQAVLADGFGPGLVALIGASLLYMLLSCCVAEVSAKLLDKVAGPSHFADACFGPRWAFLAGIAEVIKCILVVAVVTSALGDYLSQLLYIDADYCIVWWALAISFVTALNALVPAASVTFQLFITTLSVCILLVFYVGALIRGFHFERYALDYSGIFEHVNVASFAKAWPFGLWFYLGIEELPLCMNETVDPEKNMPRGLFFSFFTLVLLGFSTLFISSSIPPGAYELAQTPYPLLSGYYYVFGEGTTMRRCCLILVAGLAASLHSFFSATSHLIVNMSEHGQLPSFLSRRWSYNGACWVAALFTALVSYTLLCLIYQFSGRNVEIVGVVAIAGVLVCSLLSYIIQLACFIKLRLCDNREDTLFESPFGVAGAIVGLFLCCLSYLTVFFLPFIEPAYFSGIGAAVTLLLSALIIREIVLCIPRCRCSSIDYCSSNDI
eukprot:TRINITY_DN72782_c0_g1_i1.p1 TRINITY_DN72782_c0_g1~~TRINITY_DN72782_c0_g1_i1.p1  ORF type:complete len:475 (-),score=21.93 TRINITY_DN72782_c0_g1_i1:324-1748(-)